MIALWLREIIYCRTINQRPDPSYAIVWEDPEDMDAPTRVTIPSPVWLGMAIYGGILPPVEVYHSLAEDESDPEFVDHERGYLLHETPPIAAMTEIEAMDYLMRKDIPPRVWRDYRGNREILKIVPRSSLQEAA